jgi:hypothetical protein
MKTRRTTLRPARGTERQDPIVTKRKRASAPNRDNQRVPMLPSAEMGAITRLCYYDPRSCCNRSVASVYSGKVRTARL